MKKSLFMKVLSLILVAVLVVETTVTQASTLSFSGQVSSTSSTTTGLAFYTGCYVPVDIYLDTDTVSTNAVDVKFVRPSTFELQGIPSTYTGFVAGSLFDTYLTWAGITAWDNHIGLGTGTFGTYNGQAYRYINAYEATPATYDGKFATVYMKPAATTVELDFYFSANEKKDDSNVASGYYNGTQYSDSLSAVAGTGHYVISNDYACPFKPYTLTNAYYSSDLGQDLSAVVTAIPAAKDDTSMNSTFNGYWILDPLAPQYVNTIKHVAGHDLTTGSYTADDSWHIWTNQPIYINLTGNENIRFVTGTFTTTDAYVKIVDGPSHVVQDTWSTAKTLVVTGNITTGIAFNNTIGNVGTYYQSGTNNYQSAFMVDVFWYDNVKPNATGLLISTVGHTYVSMSGYASAGASNATAGWHASFTTDDDQFRIVGFSGTNTTDYSFSTITGYNTILNNNYVDATTQDFSMVKTGVDGTTFNGYVDFTESWSGYIYLSDIAGNVTGIWVNVDMTPKATFEVRVNPAFRDQATSNGYYTGLSTQGEFWLAEYDGSNWDFLYNSASGSVDTDVVANSNGTGSVTIPLPTSGSTYLVVFKGTGQLAIGWTGVWTHEVFLNDGFANTTGNIFDLRHISTYVSGVAHTFLYPSFFYNNTGYIKAGDVSSTGAGTWDYVNGADLSEINAGLSIGEAFPSATQEIYFDFDINTFINAIEQAIILATDAQGGFIYNAATLHADLTSTEFLP